MRPRLRLLAPLAALTAVALCVAAALAATTVRVTQPNGNTVTIDVAEIGPADQDVGPDQRYVVDGDAREVTGVSLARLLSLASVSGSSWQSVEVGPVSMTRSEYLAYGDESPPAFFVEEGDAVFIVPDRGGRSGELVRGAPAVVASGDERSVTITPDNREIDAGQSIRFRARLEGGSAAGLTFSWSGTGLERKTGQSVTYRFPDRGSYGVQVTVSEGGDPVAADGTQVFVDPKPSDKDRPGGGKDKDDDAPETGDTTPNGTDPTPSPGAPGTDPGTNQGTPGTPDTPGTPEAPETRPEPRDEPETPPVEPDVEVLGDLLSDVPAAEPEEERQLRLPGARAGTPVPESEITGSGAAFAVGLVALLLGIGVVREYGRLDPRRWWKGAASLRRLVGR